MFKSGDIIKSPWGNGVVLDNCGSAGGMYILWVGFDAHGYGCAPFRLENAYADEKDAQYYEKCGEIPDIRRILSRIQGDAGANDE